MGVPESNFGIPLRRLSQIIAGQRSDYAKPRPPACIRELSSKLVSVYIYATSVCAHQI